jgi:2-polyprenyl-3-methyl-5-hydroxy-6-metoxy-1,4-benzoquinol methylase
MIEVPCYSCGSKRHTAYASENGCNLVRCSDCGLLYVNPRPSDEEIDEGVKMGAHRGDETLDSTGHYMTTKVAIYHKVLKDIYGTDLQSRKRTWLDVGCGHGELLVALQEVSRDNVAVKGTEPNRRKIAAAVKRDLDVSYFDLAAHDEQYDCISLLNVYSHLTSPPEFLRLVKQRLRPDGEILLETGDTASLPAGRHPRPFLLPDHLSFGSQQILSNMLKKAGFEIVCVNKYPAVKLRFMKGLILKDIVKLVLPHKRSQLPWLYSSWRAGKDRTDMWIRARVTD